MSRAIHRALVVFTAPRISSRLQIGGRRTGAGFEAHAWVEIAGAVINDHDGCRGRNFSPFGGNAASVGIDSR